MSETMIYYAVGGERRGPFTLEAITPYLRPDTLVWYQGLSDWQPAAQAPLTAHLFANTPPPVGGTSFQSGYSRNIYDSRPPRPSTYLVWAILTTIFCCLPFGIVSVVYAARVDSLYAQGLYAEAEDSSRKAKNWAIWSAISSVIIAVIWSFLYIVGLMGLALI